MTEGGEPSREGLAFGAEALVDAEETVGGGDEDTGEKVWLDVLNTGGGTLSANRS